MKIDTSVYHLVVFVACLIAMCVIIVTGHDNSPLITQFAPALFGGVMGGSAAGAAPLLTAFIRGPDDSLPSKNTQAGFSRLPMIVTLLGAAIAIGACASIQQAATSDPVATACASSSVAIKTLTAAGQAGVLTTTDASNVMLGISVIAPVCDVTPEPTPVGAALTAFLAATTSLQTVAAKYQAPAG